MTDKPTTTSANSIWDEIEKDTGIDTAMLPRGASYTWFPSGVDDKGLPKAPMKFEVGKAVPGKPALTVFALFQDKHNVRVYALANANQVGETPPPHRYTLSKIAPTSFAEVMGLSVFKYELGEELVEMAGDAMPDPGPEDEDEPAGAIVPAAEGQDSVL